MNFFIETASYHCDSRYGLIAYRAGKHDREMRFNDVSLKTKSLSRSKVIHRPFWNQYLRIARNHFADSVWGMRLDQPNNARGPGPVRRLDVSPSRGPHEVGASMRFLE